MVTVKTLLNKHTAGFWNFGQVLLRLVRVQVVGAACLNTVANFQLNGRITRKLFLYFSTFTFLYFILNKVQIEDEKLPIKYIIIRD